MGWDYSHKPLAFLLQGRASPSLSPAPTPTPTIIKLHQVLLLEALLPRKVYANTGWQILLPVSILRTQGHSLLPHISAQRLASTVCRFCKLRFLPCPV